MTEMKNGKVVRRMDLDVLIMSDVFINGEFWKVISKSNDGVEVAKIDARDRQVMEKTRKVIKVGDLI